MGSTPHAHAMAKVDDPEHQGEVAMVGVFVDTFIVLNMTALVIPNFIALIALSGVIASSARK